MDLYDPLSRIGLTYVVVSDELDSVGGGIGLNT